MYPPSFDISTASCLLRVSSNPMSRHLDYYFGSSRRSLHSILYDILLADK